MTARTTFLSNATVNITQGATSWDVSDMCTAFSLSVGQEELDATVFGDTGRRMVGGLQQIEVSMTLFLSYGTTEVEGMLAAIAGTGTTVVTASPSGTTESASNPEYVLTNVMFSSVNVINSTVGELATVELSGTAGTWVRDITSP
jgi:hypothetical protein